MGMSRASATVGAVAGVASSLVSYANKNMASNFQLDYFNTQSQVAGGGGRGGWLTANRLAFQNNNVALNGADATRAGFLNQYTFGNAQFNGAANPAFVNGMSQANAFGYASPTQGAYGAALAAQQTYSSRAAYVAPSLGLASPYLQGGVKNSMQNIAQSIYQRTFGSQTVNQKQFNAAISQGGSLNVNLQAFGSQLGWSQSTIAEYQNALQGQVAAQQHGMSANKYYQLLGQASGGNRSAINQLAKTTGLGSSMFENQRNLNSTRLTRQSDILESLAPAFDSATSAVNKFSQALTSFLQTTGLDKAIGTGAGGLAPFSNALGGFSGAFGAGAGLLSAGRLFRGGGGLLGGLGRGGAAAGGAGALDLSAGALGAAGLYGAGAFAVHHFGGKLVDKYVHGKKANKWSHVGVDAATGALTGAAIGSVVPVIGTGVGAAVGGIVGAGIGIFGGATGEGGVTGTTGNSARNSSTQGATTASAAQIIKYAETQLGVPYVWGGESPGKGMDCSGLTQWAYGKAGVKIPRVAADQQKIGNKVPTNKTQPGDLLFVGDPAHHVVMSIGGGKIIEAPHPGANVNIRALNPSEFTSATRIVGSIGNMNSLLNENTDNSGGSLNNQQSVTGGDLGNLGGTSEAAAIASALAGSTAGIPMVSQGGSSNSVTSAGTGSNPKATGSNAKGHLQAYAKALLGKYGWGSQWGSFNALEMSEAGWDVHATNPSSGAYGLAQALPAGKYASAGKDWRTSGETQLRWMMDYVKSRYGSPDAAWSFHQKNNWYAAGAWNIDKDQPATVHKGEMIIPAQQAETIRQTLLNNTFNPNLQRAMGHSGGSSITFGDINVALPATYSGSAQDARAAGKMVVDAIEENLRIKNLQTGQ
jgi:cell wall-associated NlpC family hydrolase